MNELALFAGAGGGILGGKLLGWRTVCAVENEPYAIAVLIQRQNDKILQPFPIWDDVRTFDGTKWRGCIDVVSGGFPCQDISIAGKGKGLNGSRSGLWSEMFRIIGEVRPRYAWIENSPMLTSRGGTRVIADLASLGYDCLWGVVGAYHAGAPHKRERIWILAYAGNDTNNSERRAERETKRIQGEYREKRRSWLPNRAGVDKKVLADSMPTRERRKQRQEKIKYDVTWWDEDPAEVANPQKLQRYGSNREPKRKVSESGNDCCQESGDRETQSFVGRVAHGVAYRVDRLKAIGNGQVPAVVKLAWEILSNELS